VAYPDNSQGFGPTSHPVGNYKGDQIYAEWFEFGNYWIAYVSSLPFVGSGMSPGLAGVDFRRTAALVEATTPST